MLTQNANAHGINVLGHVTGDFGLGEAMRCTLKAMDTTSIPYNIFDLKVDGQPNLDSSYITESSHGNTYQINLVHTNPNWVEKIFQGYFPGVNSELFKSKYNIGFWLWELPEFPSDWEFALDLFDEIWTPSKHTTEAISRVSPVPVITIPLSITCRFSSLSRTELGLPSNKFVFLFIFDLCSSFERKNPLAVIQAFKKAFKQYNDDVVLVLKFAGSQHFPKQKAQIVSETKGWQNIKFIEGHLEKDKIYGLLKNCDCYISLHRAEGFGLTMAEAMFYGKPVIATGYSSNLDFMNVGNSFLAKYDLVELTENTAHYPKGSIWADTDVDSAAVKMRYVFEHQQEATSVGAKAAKDIRTLLDPEVVGKKIKRRFEYIINHKLSTFTEKLQVETAYLEAQTLAWQKAAVQVQKELNSLQS